MSSDDTDFNPDELEALSARVCLVSSFELDKTIQLYSSTETNFGYYID